METVSPEKKTKAAERRSNFSTLRVRRDFAKKFHSELQKINEKKHGRRVRSDELMTHLLGFLTNDGRRALQEATMSNQDLIERDYQEYCATHQKISKDEYFGMLRQGALAASSGVSRTHESQSK
jgi:hypothetical protein